MIKLKKIILLFFLFLNCGAFAGAEPVSLSRQEIDRTGERIFENECASNDEWLVRWNEGEDFLSLGIGHFIWYPERRRAIFEESFPAFLTFAKASGTKLPVWLDTQPSPPCPWNSMDEFLLRRADDGRIAELENFLKITKSLQASFIIKRFNDNLPLLLENAAGEEQERIKRQIERLASVPGGTFAMIDYSNFKGYGLVTSERYHGRGWGLFQVLAGMRNEKEAPDVMAEFIETAKRILAERVANSPKERNEARWLAGWQRRVDLYIAGQ